MMKLTIKEISKNIKAKKISAQEVVDYFLNEIANKNKEINAYIEVFESLAKQRAKYIDENLEQFKDSPLAGVPIATKDNILIKGQIASAASKILKTHKAAYNATVVNKLLANGAILIGRTNMDEFAMGSSGENSAYGPTRNPVDTTKVPGGSSSGSTAAVASGMTAAALGTDTGGSIRQPASFCGVVGFKPSYGRVSRYGVIAMGSSLDQVGPLARTVEDAEILFNAIKGKDSHDATSTDDDLSTIKETYSIAVPLEFINKYVNSEVKQKFHELLDDLKNQGHEIKEISIDNLDKALLAYYIIMSAEVSTNLARYDGMRFGERLPGESYSEIMANTRANLFGTEVKRRILLGTFVLSAGYKDAYYKKAMSARGYIKSVFDEIFQQADFMLTPTTPTPAFSFGEKSDPVSMYAADIFTVPVNIAYLPAISVPYAKTEGGLPLGAQFIAPFAHDAQLFDIGKKVKTCNNINND